MQKNSRDTKELANSARRGELSSTDNPVKLCHEISRLTGARVRSVNLEGIMSQHSARLVMGVLSRCEIATQKEIVERTHLRPPTVSVLLRNMQEEGMVELRQNPDDRRELRATLTEYGRSVDRKVIEKIKETDAIALDGFSESELCALEQFLLKIRDNLLCDRAGEDRE